ncbi:AraC family transcriptional regulator [Pseudomonas citronellolis]|uniref:AraC family transcriptional regulator n=1 Tax=Pseudomonas citronellolis TaxID=53408 RepID=UPI0023E37DEE|nr:AraC family transcriptional regulator [Pseudomonas citronellolis]MDF3932548.1 AraC family transcriptional regulator [Pseudomonas citronellolis]
MDLSGPLTERLLRLATREGYTLTALPDVRLLRCDRPLQRTPVLYEPGIVIVCQGRKWGHFGERDYLYDASHYLAVSVPVPFDMQTHASAREPLLAVYLQLDLEVAAELLVELADQGASTPQAPASMVSSPMDEALQGSLLRLLDALASPLEAQLLGPALRREIYYRVFTGPQGAALRAALGNQEHFGRIAGALRTLHQQYAQPLKVQDLAAQAHMSPAAFHLHFKAVTATSPIQYLKSLRLHRARLLMLQQGLAAAAASYQVGYESPSHFGREFKRLFGRSPQQEVERLRQAFAYPAGADAPLYVASH